jgi:hypothetical protein
MTGGCLTRLRICLVIALLAITLPADVVVAQVRPEQRPPPLSKRKPKVEQPAAPMPAPPPAPGTAPAADEFAYLPPGNVPVLSKAPGTYHAPEGFGGRTWGETRVTFDRLPDPPVMVRAAWTNGLARQPESVCMGGSTGKVCRVDFVLDSLLTRPEGGSFHVLSEYRIPGQGFRFKESGALIFPVIYQFCANWEGTRREVPRDFDALNRFCGMRLPFKTESLEQLSALPEDHVTKYDLVVAELIAMYGKPAGTFKRGRATIKAEADPEDKRPEEDRKFNTWRWCPEADRSLAPRCEASIVVSVDPDSGHAAVLFPTPALREYAYARQPTDEGGDPLFAVMHARNQAGANR